jgi:hypothetical protein
MGYDVTIHLVDPAVVQGQFVPWLLGEVDGNSPMEQCYPEDAARLLAEARTALADASDPKGAARLVCLLAASFSGCLLPYACVRGYANLTLWTLMPDELSATLSTELYRSPEHLFEPLVREHPQLKGGFDDHPIENYGPGYFVPPKKVAETLVWVEGNLATYDETDAVGFSSLVRVLRAAKAASLGVWEMVDAPCRTDGRFPGDPTQRMNAMLDLLTGVTVAEPEADRAPLGWPESSLPWLTHADSSMVLMNCDGGGRRYDLSVWPPRSTSTAGNYGNTLLLADGTIVRHDHGRRRCVAWFAQDDLIKPARELEPFVDKQPFPTAGIALFGHRLVLWPKQGKRPRRRPAVETADGTFELLHMLPWPSRGGIAAVATLGDGSPVLLWDDRGYECLDGAWEPTFSIQGTARYGAFDGLSTQPAGTDGFYFVQGEQLALAKRGQEPTAALPARICTRHVYPGPPGALLLDGWRSGKAEIGLLWWMDEGLLQPIPSSLVPRDDPEGILHGPLWCEATERLIVWDYQEFRGIPFSTVLDLPCYSLKTGRKASRGG